VWRGKGVFPFSPSFLLSFQRLFELRQLVRNEGGERALSSPFNPSVANSGVAGSPSPPEGKERRHTKKEKLRLLVDMESFHSFDPL